MGCGVALPVFCGPLCGKDSSVMHTSPASAVVRQLASVQYLKHPKLAPHA